MGLFNRKKQEEIKRDSDVTPLVDTSTVSIPFSSIVSGAGGSFILDRYITDPETLSAFFGGVELISNQIAACPILVKKFSDYSEINNHPIILALKYGKMTKFNFIKQLIHDAYTAGNGIAYIKRDVNGEIKELVYVKPGDYNIWVDPLTKEVRYTFPNLTGTKYLDSSNVIHIFKNSKDGLVGVSISSYAKISIPLSSAADKNALQFYDSGGNISGVLQSNRSLDTEEKMEAYVEWTNAFRGGNKNGNVAVLGNDFEYKPVGISQKDAQQLETRQFNIIEICRYLNINPILLGISSGSTYNNIEQAQLDLVIHTLLPWIELIEEEFNRKLIRPSQRSQVFIDFDEDKLAFSDKTSTANYLTTLTKNGIISINDARKSLGYQPKEGCDDLIIPYTDVNANKVNGDGKNTDKKEE